jgi:hypothetical protein
MEISGGDSSDKPLEIEILYEGLASKLLVVQEVSLVSKVKGVVLKKLRLSRLVIANDERIY